MIGPAPNMTVMVLGLSSFDLNESLRISWSSLSEILTPLKSGTPINKVSQNFINWSSEYSVYIAGHISRLANQTSQHRMIDVTDFHKRAIARGGAHQLTFLLYRPFRHSKYRTNAGAIYGS